MTDQTQPAYMFPTSVKEVERLGWDYIDIILFSGDAFIDHPSSGTAMIARVLQREGWRVAVVPQPNWQDDLRDFRKLGVPRLFFGVNSGAMDSMVNHYTAAKRLRSNDAYTMPLPSIPAFSNGSFPMCRWLSEASRLLCAA